MKILSFLILLFTSSIIFAGSITVIGDVNADANEGGDNSQFYTNILGDSSSVLFSRGNTAPAINGAYSLYNGKSGVSVTSSNTTITNSILNKNDMLIMNQSTFNENLVYTQAELTAISSFISGGGDLLFVAESNSTTVYNNLNAFLTGIGSTIQYTGQRIVQSINTTNISSHLLTTNVTTYKTNCYNILSGGTTIIQDSSNRNIVMTEVIGNNSNVPEPASIVMLVLGLLGLFLRYFK